MSWTRVFTVLAALIGSIFVVLFFLDHGNQIANLALGLLPMVYLWENRRKKSRHA